MSGRDVAGCEGVFWWKGWYASAIGIPRRVWIRVWGPIAIALAGAVIGGAGMEGDSVF